MKSNFQRHNSLSCGDIHFNPVWFCTTPQLSVSYWKQCCRLPAQHVCLCFHFDHPNALLTHSNFSVPMPCDLRAILPWLPWRHIIASKCPMTQQRETCPASSFLPALACNIINQAPKPLYRDYLPEVNTYYFSGPFVLYRDCACVIVWVGVCRRE